MRLPIAGSVVGALLLLAGPSHAQRAPEWDYCDLWGLGTPDVRIDNCTTLINSNELSPADRAVAYHNRGEIRTSQHDYVHAIADDTEAIRLNPRFASAYYNRGYAYH